MVFLAKRVLRRGLTGGSEKGGFQKVPRTPPRRVPKGPFRTKNSTARKSVAFCHRRSFSESVPFSSLFSLERQAFPSPLRSVLLPP